MVRIEHQDHKSGIRSLVTRFEISRRNGFPQQWDRVLHRIETTMIQKMNSLRNEWKHLRIWLVRLKTYKWRSFMIGRSMIEPVLLKTLHLHHLRKGSGSWTDQLSMLKSKACTHLRWVQACRLEAGMTLHCRQSKVCIEVPSWRWETS